MKKTIYYKGCKDKRGKEGKPKTITGDIQSCKENTEHKNIRKKKNENTKILLNLHR